MGMFLKLQTQIFEAQMNYKFWILGPPATVVKCISMIYDILERVPAKGNEQRYDPNMFDPTYDYGGLLIKSYLQFFYIKTP